MLRSPSRWRALMATLATALAVTAALPVTASAAPVDHSSTATIAFEPSGKPFEVQIAKADETGMRVDPPMGGCYLGNVGGTITGFWTNGTLTRTESTYFSSIDCTVTAAGQTMDNLWGMASINLSAGGGNSGTIGSCTYPNMEMAPCVSVRSTGRWTCPLGVLCAGDYWVDHETFMTLPEGWVWVNVPSYCTVMSDRQLSCLVESGRVTIPAFK